MECPYGDEDDSGCNNNDKGNCTVENPELKPEGPKYGCGCLSWVAKKEKRRD